MLVVYAVYIWVYTACNMFDGVSIQGWYSCELKWLGDLLYKLLTRLVTSCGHSCMDVYTLAVGRKLQEHNENC